MQALPELSSIADGGSAAAAVPEGSSDDAVEDMTIAEHPANPHDYVLFLNLVELCNAVLPLTDALQFADDCMAMVVHLCHQLRQHPRISGFYKLLQICMRQCDKTSLFSLEKRSTSICAGKNTIDAIAITIIIHDRYLHLCVHVKSFIDVLMKR